MVKKCKVYTFEMKFVRGNYLECKRINSIILTYLLILQRKGGGSAWLTSMLGFPFFLFIYFKGLTGALHEGVGESAKMERCRNSK